MYFNLKKSPFWPLGIIIAECNKIYSFPCKLSWSKTMNIQLLLYAKSQMRNLFKTIFGFLKNHFTTSDLVSEDKRYGSKMRWKYQAKAKMQGEICSTAYKGEKTHQVPETVKNMTALNSNKQLPFLSEWHLCATLLQDEAQEEKRKRRLAPHLHVFSPVPINSLTTHANCSPQACGKVTQMKRILSDGTEKHPKPAQNADQFSQLIKTNGCCVFTCIMGNLF